MSVRLVPAPISLEFEHLEADEEGFEREYHSLSESDDDPIGQWLKLAKAKGDFSESDPILINLMVELYRKVDGIEKLLKNEVPQKASLGMSGDIESIGFGYFKLETPQLTPGKAYYGRVDMPVHPRRDVGIFFTAESDSLARITKMHERDEKEWAVYLTARERVLIRESKGNA